MGQLPDPSDLLGNSRQSIEQRKRWMESYYAMHRQFDQEMVHLACEFAQKARALGAEERCVEFIQCTDSKWRGRREKTLRRQKVGIVVWEDTDTVNVDTMNEYTHRTWTCLDDSGKFWIISNQGNTVAEVSAESLSWCIDHTAEYGRGGTLDEAKRLLQNDLEQQRDEYVGRLEELADIKAGKRKVWLEGPIHLFIHR